jgi:hypothetical protein
MCGEIDEDIHIDNEVLARLLFMAKRLGVAPHGDSPAIPQLDVPAGRAAYMDALFTAGLTRAVSDTEAAAEGQRVEAIAAQAIAFSRLAGFLAGQLPPESDLFRATVEALTDGHAEPRRIAQAERARHAHHHHHHHDGHDHHHGENGHGHGHHG